jgi:hypothetical protein
MTHTTTLTSALVWTPTFGVINHGGDLLGTDAIFFAAPPAEIGNLLSADSTLGADLKTKKRNGYTTYLNWFQALLWAGLAGFLTWFILALLIKNDITAILAGVTVAAFTFWRTFEKDGHVSPATCTFVGSQGIAQYVWDDDESKRQTPHLLLFQNATELRTLETRHFIKNAYQYTTYVYQWYDSSRAGFSVSGLYINQNSLSESRSYHFALAAEKAWTLFKMERALDSLLQGNSVSFDIKNGDTLILTNEAVELRRKGKTVRIDYKDNPHFDVQQGVMTLTSQDTSRSFFGDKGSYSFNYHDVTNAQLLLLLFNTLTKA